MWFSDRIRDGAIETYSVSVSGCANWVQRFSDRIRDASENDAAFNLLVEGPTRDLHPIIRDEMYRISREALSNAFKHAHARHIEAEISYGLGAFCLRIRDDGEGIPAEVLDHGRTGHFGLRGIRERAKQVGAELTIWSRPGTGTEIDLSLNGATAYGTSERRSRFRLFRQKGDKK